MNRIESQQKHLDRQTAESLVGTHNTMSYLAPRTWWGRLLRVFARCQDLSLEEQIRAGVKVFDLRVVLLHGVWTFAHGIVDFDPSETLHGVIGRLPAGSVVRIIMERDRGDCIPFDVMCSGLERDYPHLTFIGGRRKSDWLHVHRFAGEEIWPDSTLHQHVGSMASDARWYERLIPVLYARRTRGRHTPADGINLYDFVQKLE